MHVTSIIFLINIPSASIPSFKKFNTYQIIPQNNVSETLSEHCTLHNSPRFIIFWQRIIAWSCPYMTYLPQIETVSVRERGTRRNRKSGIVFCLFPWYLPLSAKMQRVFTRKVRFNEVTPGKNKKEQLKIIEFDRWTNRDLI